MAHNAISETTKIIKRHKNRGKSESLQHFRNEKIYIIQQTIPKCDHYDSSFCKEIINAHPEILCKYLNRYAHISPHLLLNKQIQPEIWYCGKT